MMCLACRADALGKCRHGSPAAPSCLLAELGMHHAVAHVRRALLLALSLI